jgi:hypothetical protein
MNDNDLERRLRAESGPRERGYIPAQMPSTLDDGGSSTRRQRMVHAPILLLAAVAGVIVVAAAARLLGGGAPLVGSGSPTSQPSASLEATPSSSAEPTTEPGTCAPNDLSYAAEPWGGAAGSRGTVLNARRSDPATTCYLPLAIEVTIRDAAGSVVISGIAPPMEVDSILIHRGGPAISVVWSNWCGPAIARPLSLEISFGASEPFPVGVAEGGDDPVPPCLGADESQLSVTLAVIVD